MQATRLRKANRLNSSRKGHKHLTVVYQIDQHCKRLLWVSESRTSKSLQGFFDLLRPKRSE
ncbi:MAG: transposase [Gammaproteobacteria bacterium]|nr:transposase [Gammaproteobacteria bacterium]